MENFIEAKEVVKQYASHLALDHVSINVRKGRVFGLLGPNGAGKTTLIRIINRITIPDSGIVMFDGHPICAADMANIGYLPEERGLYKKMEVGEQAVYLSQLKGLSASEAKKRLRLWFDKFGIMPWWNKKLEELSKGMQQKVQFVITVLHEPSLLIFDEPFSGFDPVNADLLKREILELKEKGHTIIFSTHNMSSVEEICDDIALINNSKVVLSGEVDDIKKQFRTGLFNVCTEDKALPAPSADDPYELVSVVPDRSTFVHSIRKTRPVSNSQLVALLSERGEIRAFAEQMPSMHDIFIKTVSQQTNDSDK